MDAPPARALRHQYPIRDFWLGAAIGIVSCLGALGGFAPPLLLGWTMDHHGGPAWAYTGRALFALLCLAVNLWFYHRRTSPTHC